MYVSHVKMAAESLSVYSHAFAQNGTHLPPALIYKGESHDLQDSWVDDLGNDTAYFTASNNG